MITCNLMGGLGNQLFQIFATISYAIKTHNLFKFTNKLTLGGGSTTIRKTYWDSFFSRLNHFTTDEFPKMNLIKEKDFTFNELPLYNMINSDIIIHIKQKKTNLLKKMNYDETFLNNVISLHFRIGDYKKNTAVHPIMPKEYYHKSIVHILSNYKDSDIKFTVMFFCEDIDTSDVKKTITFLSKKFPKLEFVRGENKLEDWEQMLLMSCCHHNIIANSSFSWWSAYFNSWEDKIICYPSLWFGPSVKHNTKDLCPVDWIKILV